MSLVVPLAQLLHQTVSLEGELDPSFLADALHAEVDLIRVDRPLAYKLVVRRLGSSVLVEGSLRTNVECQCVRCLAPFRYAVELGSWSVLLPLDGEEEVPIIHEAVDLTPYVREDTLLALPQHPLCDPECRGLLPKASGGAKNPDTSDPQSDQSSPWSALDQLKL